MHLESTHAPRRHTLAHRSEPLLPGEFDDYEQRQPHGAEGNVLSDYLRMLGRKRRLILILALCGAMAGLLLEMRSLPLYRARTSLDIQKLSSDPMGMGAVSPVADASSGGGDTYVQTQIKLLESETLLAGTLEKLRQEPHPAFIERDDLFSRLRRMAHLGTPAPLPYDKVLQDAAQRIKVKPLGLTRLVEVTCDSWSASFSARVCNTLTRTFREQDYATRGAEAAKTGDWLTRQVADVRQQAEDARQKLVQATGGNGLELNQQGAAVSEDRLREVQEEYVRAQADRMQKEALWDESQHAPADTLPSIIEDPTVRALQAGLNDLRGRVAAIVPPLTEQDPKVIHLRAQIAQAEAELQRDRGSILERLQNDYLAAKQHEYLLNVTYHLQEQDTSGELVKADHVDLLRGEFQSEQQLYQTLLQRAKEAGFASAMQISTIRIVDAAKAPRFAYAPRSVRAVFVGSLLGLLAGVTLALYRERTAGVIHMPGELQRLLHVQELGVIPNTRAMRAPLWYSRAALWQRLHGGGGRALALSGNSPDTLGGLEAAAGLSVWRDRHSLAAEAYRNATFSILLASRAEQPAKMYVIASPSAGDGKTTVATNLGVALSQSRKRVVLVDGDMRKPGLHKALGVENTSGLRELLKGTLDPETAPLDSFCRPTQVPNLFAVTAGSGSEDISELLYSARAALLLKRLKSEFDLVLIDTPPLLHMSDARVLTEQADGAILIFRAGVTTREQAATACDVISHDGKRLLGIILNAFHPGRAGRPDYYNSYYRYKQAADWMDQTPANV